MIDRVPERCIIAAMGEGREIGFSGSLARTPWDILPAGRRWFRDLTANGFVIMGEQTYKQSGNNPGRHQIILSRGNLGPAVEVARTLEEAMAKALVYQTGRVAIIGGQDVFEDAVTNAEYLGVDTLYLAVIKGRFPNADTFFPANYASVFTKVAEEKTDRAGGDVWFKLRRLNRG